MKKVVLLTLLICAMGMAACNNADNDVLHLGVNAVITGLNTEDQQITVNGTEEDSFWGEGCVISCDSIPMIYCNYESGEVKQISIHDLQVGDDVIFEISESDITHFLEGESAMKIQQLQLGTQRLK